MATNENNNKSILESIDSPKDLRNLSLAEKEHLAAEIRNKLIEVVSRTGGHLAPNLGVVELTIALHTAFNTPEDKLIWDIGHQGYVHKLLTGRREFFHTLRQDDGCLGFLSREESKYDIFGAGHAGTAISAALGMAVARDRKNGKEKIVAVVGDGSLNCGISLEGLNNIAETTRDFIVVLNDNKMSISKNVGAMARSLNRIISGRSYNRFKALIRTMVRRVPRFGDDITRVISRVEEAAKSMFVPGVIFEELGMRYIGPINGHNIEELVRTFNAVKDSIRPVIIHVITEKGHGYPLAEEAPEKFHGLSRFDPETGESLKSSGSPTFSSAFGKAMCELAEKHEDVIAITAAMRYGTGFIEFAERFPKRFFDVGIAEEHAVVFAAGLSVEGFRPVVAIYATFLQRAMDYVFHDVCLQNLPVIICADRSGIVEDGPTHHGIHDLSFFRNMPNISILSPKDEFELRNMLFASYEHRAPVIIRYPRGDGSGFGNKSEVKEIFWGKSEVLEKGSDLAIWALGKECSTAVEVSKILKSSRISTTVVNTRFIRPFDSELLLEQAKIMPLITIEDCQVQGGLGSAVDEILVNSPHKGVYHYGWGLDIVPHGTIPEIRKKAGLTPEIIAESYLKLLKL